MFPHSPTQLFFTGRLIRRENWAGTYWMIFLLTFQIMLIPLSMYWSNYINLLFEDPTRMRVIVYAAFALAFLIATIVVVAICLRTFGKGLKPYLARTRVRADVRLDGITRVHDVQVRSAKNGKL